MIEIFNFEQGSPEWFAMREGKLTASQYGKVVSTRKVRYAELAKDPTDTAIHVSPRATAQMSVVELLQEHGRLPVKDLNASAVKALEDKGVVTIDEDDYGCVLSKSAALAHIDGMLAEIHYDEDDLEPDKPSFAMERGTRLEEVARIDFEMRTGIDVEEVGFIVNPEIGQHVGCSPDGIIDGGKGGIEIKCPMPATHFAYHRAGILPPVYKAQVHGCMAVTDADYWWFTSFCPSLKDFTLKIYRNEYTENLKRALQEFDALFIEQAELAKTLKQ